MSRLVLLVDIGPDPLPQITPVSRAPINWAPPPKAAVVVPPPTDVEVKPGTDSITITWSASPLPGAEYVVWRAADVRGAPGAWEIVTRTTDTRYTYTDTTGAVSWWKITVLVNGVSSGDSDGSPMTPVVPPTTAELILIQQRLDKETADRFEAVAAESQARADAVADLAEDLSDAARLSAEGIAANAAAIAAEASERASALLNERLEWKAGLSREAAIRENADESLAYAMSQVSAGSGTQFDSRNIWYFDATSDGWTCNGEPSVVDGWLRPADATSFPYLQSPDGLDIDGGAYRFVKLRIKRVGSPVWAGRLQWATAAAPVWSDTRAVTVPEPVWDRDGVATIDFQDVGWWPSVLKQIRIQVGAAQDESAHHLIDWVAIGRPTPGAGVALVQQEAAARITADSVEATQRESLAVQLRGDYEGDDLSGLTTGLIASEQLARIDGDEAVMRVVEVIQARMPEGDESLATEASVVSEREARLEADLAQAKVSQAIQARLPDGDGAVASVDALDSVTGRVENNEQGLVAMGERVVSMTAQLDGTHAGDEDTFAGDDDTYAGTITVYTVIADGDRAVGKQVELVDANLGAFKSSATSQLVAMATEVAASAEKVDSVRVELEGKASTESLSQLRNSVEQNADGIVAVAEGLQSVRIDLGGKASAQVVQGMETRVQQNEQGLIQVLARAFMQVMADAGGGPLIGGMVIDNNGSVVNTRFLSTTFEVIAPGAANGMELRDGYLRVWAGNSQRIIGNGFGADGLMDYFGPNVGVAAANKLNAKMWMDRNGDAYWGGTLRAGAINSSGQFNLNNANWDSASNISVVHAGSQGRTKVVLWSARLSAEVISFGNSPQPTRTGTMRLRVWRDAALLWDESITASSVNVYEGDSNRTLTTQTWQWPQRSFTDTTNATGNIPYRMQIDFVGGTRYDIPAFVVGAEASVAVLNIIES